MLEANKWGNKVRIIGLSIDDNVNTVRSHVQRKGWNKIEHYHIKSNICKASEEYSIKGVPFVVLIDKNGTIVFMGHPSEKNLEQEINLLINTATDYIPDKIVAGKAVNNLDSIFEDFRQKSQSFMDKNKE